jgi:hypothetical protein
MLPLAFKLGGKSRDKGGFMSRMTMQKLNFDADFIG